MVAGNNEFVILGKTLNLEVESPTVKSFKLKRDKDLFSFTVEIRCKKAKKSLKRKKNSNGNTSPQGECFNLALATKFVCYSNVLL